MVVHDITSFMSSPLEKLQNLFMDFPGIGPRQARRFAYALLKKNDRYINDLISAIQDARANTRPCEDSYQYFYATDAHQTKAPIALDPNRDDTTLLVVEKDVDIESIERSNTYRGRYFVLGGTLPILAEEPEKAIRINELKNVADRKAKQSGLREIILGMSFHPEGENTAQYVADALHDLSVEHGFAITTLARGLSTGTEIEYTDEDTLKSALQNRL